MKLKFIDDYLAVEKVEIVSYSFSLNIAFYLTLYCTFTYGNAVISGVVAVLFECRLIIVAVYLHYKAVITIIFVLICL